MDPRHAVAAEMAERGTDPPQLLLKEAHHRIANDLAVLSSMVRLQALSVKDSREPLSPAEARALLTDAAGRIEAVGRLHRTLWAQLNGDTASAFIEGICSDAASFAGRKNDVFCVINLPSEVPPERLRTLGLLIHELVLNALKHAHPSGVRGRIDISCREEANGVLSIDVMDDGVGFPDGFDHETDGGFGLKMIRELAGQLDALVSFDSSSLGVICRLRSRPRAPSEADAGFPHR